MKKIALIPMAAKPYHAGHDGLVRLAAKECDEVHLFVSNSDRKRKGELPIYGNDMLKIWSDYIEPSLPANVIVEYVSTPVAEVYKEIEDAEAQRNNDSLFIIYSDSEDILKYTEKSLNKAAPTLYSNNQIETKGINRGEQTTDISGTKMRNLISNNDVESFIELLPKAIQQYGYEIFRILKNSTVTENLLKSYIKLCI